MLKTKLQSTNNWGSCLSLEQCRSQCPVQTFLKSEETKAWNKLPVIRTGLGYLGKHCKSFKKLKDWVFVYLFELIWNILHSCLSSLYEGKKKKEKGKGRGTAVC